MTKEYILSLLASLFLFGSSICFSQDNPEKQLQDMNLISPNAASLGKFVEYPVNLHTGVPDISIPIHTVTEGTLKLPISLSYNASGIKVAEAASWVGLGWALNANGVISRSVRGMPDEKVSSAGTSGTAVGFYQDHGYSNYFLNEWGNLDYLNFAQGYKDGEPDLFFFNFNGYSGKFVFRENNTALVIPHQNIRIEPVFCDESEDCNEASETLRAWKVTTPDGVKYYFGMSLDNATYGAPAIEKTHAYSERAGQTISTIISSWYLYRIEAPDGKSVIRFRYEPEQYSSYSLSMGASGFSALDDVEDNVLVKSSVDGVRLSSIEFTQGRVDFVPASGNRIDLGGYLGNLTQGTNTQAKALKSVEIRNGGDYCKVFDLETDYFLAKSIPLQGPLSGRESTYKMTSHRYRLKLRSVQERSCNGKVSVPRTEFEYDESSRLPNTLSFAVDHWGYYNAADFNLWLIPKLSLDGGNTYSTGGANRETNASDSKVGSLKKIYHSTGGSTEFVYGTDQTTVRPNGTTPELRQIGGLRIDQINKRDNNGNLVLSTTYEYPAGAILFGVPKYIAIIRNPVLRFGDNTKVVENGCISKINGPPPFEFAFSAASVHPMKTTLGSHKGYEIVKVSKANEGYSLYQYDISQAPDISRDVSVRKVNIQECTGDEPLYPAVPENQPLNRGQLILEQHFASGDSPSMPLQETSYQNEYVTDPVGVHGFMAPGIGSAGSYYPPADYQVKSGYKSTETKIQKNRQRATNFVQEVKTVTTYSSVLFNMPVNVALHETILGVSQPMLEGKTTYVKDLSPCNDDPTNRMNSYETGMTFYYNTYQTNLNKCLTQVGRQSICNDLQGCNQRPGDPCSSEADCRFCVFTNYQIQINEVRKNFINSAIGARESDCLNDLVAVQDPSYQAILDLNKENHIALPVETTEWKYGKLVKGASIHYATHGTRVFADNSQKIDIVAPVDPSDFDPISVANDAIVKDAGYNADPEARYKYENGRLVEVLNKNASATSFIWDEVNDQILVKGENIIHQDLKTAYQNALNAGAAGSAAFNASIRSGAPAAMITTYQHTNLVGMVSVTDPNNSTSTFEYDELGRLKIVKDDQGSIVKYYDYQFNKKR